MKILKKSFIRIYSILFLFVLSAALSSCNNINILDDFIDDSLNQNNTESLPINDGMSIDNIYTDWGNIPSMFSETNESLPNGDIVEFKIAINSSRTQLYFYFKTLNMMDTATNDTMVVNLTNDLGCDGKRITLVSGFTYLWNICDTSGYIPIGSVGITAGGNMTTQIEGSMDLTSFGSYLPQNKKLFLSVHSVYFTPSNKVIPITDSIPGKWIMFRP